MRTFTHYKGFLEHRFSPSTPLRDTRVFHNALCFHDTHVLRSSPSRYNYAPQRNGVRNAQVVRNIRAY